MTAASPGPVVVVGGAVMDTKTVMTAPPVLRTSNPGRASSSPGGVGRNIAENIARLGHRTLLLTALGADAIGQELTRHTSGSGVEVHNVLTLPATSGVYVAVLDDRSELLVGVSDMSATDSLTVPMFSARSEAITGAALLVVEGNIPVSVIGWLLALASDAAVPVVLDTVSVAKAERLRPILDAATPVLAVTPNLDELAALSGTEVLDEPRSLADAAARLHERGVEHVWVRRGPRGSVLHTRGAEAVELAAPAARPVDVTGAGDSMTAGFVYSYLQSPDVVAAARFGQVLAALTVEAPETVRPDLTAALVADRAAHSLPKET